MISKRLIYIHFCFLFFLITACMQDRYAHDTPETLLSKEKMADILIDVHLVESDLKSFSKEVALGQFVRTEKEILKKHNIDSLTFQQNYQYYAERLPEFEQIYKLVVDSLQTLKDRYMNNELQNPIQQ